ncbi:MAG: iron dicitrate transport regulator FecR, partial [Pedobacter sp.]
MQYSDQLLQAIENYLNGNATAAEQQMVNDWYRSFDDAEVIVDVNDAAYEKLVDARLKLRIHKSAGVVIKEVKTIRLWPRIAGIAAAVAAITLGVWLYNISNTPRHPEFSSGSPLANDVAPGKHTATLTLANGKTINLSDAKTG